MEVLEQYLKKDLEGRIKDRVRGRGITHYAAVEFKKKLNAIKIGQEISLAGFLSSTRRGWFLEFPPGSNISINVFGNGLEDYIEGMYLVKGIVRPLMDGMKVIGKQIQATKVEEDYYSTYDLDIAPLTPFETFSLFRERINAPEYILKALFLSPISSPIVLDMMGGVSSIFDFPSRVGRDRRRSKNMHDVADVVLQMVPSWHRTLNSSGFSLSKISRVETRLGSLLRERKSSRPEIGVIYPRTSYGNIEKFYEASLIENTIILQNIVVQKAPDFDRFLNEIQWSIMINHAQLRRIEKEDLPTGFNKKIDDWFEKIREKDSIFEQHIRYHGLLDRNFQGRRGIILRVMAAIARFEGRPPSESHLSESLMLQEGLLEEFIYEHGGIIEDYEEHIFLKTRSKKIKKIRNLIFDICLSEGGINRSRIKQEAQKLNLKEKDVDQVLYNLIQEGFLYQPTNDDFYKLT